MKIKIYGNSYKVVCVDRFWILSLDQVEYRKLRNDWVNRVRFSIEIDGVFVLALIEDLQLIDVTVESGIKKIEIGLVVSNFFDKTDWLENGF